MIFVVVGQQDDVDVRKVVEINAWVVPANAGDTGPEVDMVTGVEEVWLYRSVSEHELQMVGTTCIGHEPNALPFSGNSRVSGLLTH